MSVFKVGDRVVLKEHEHLFTHGGKDWCNDMFAYVGKVAIVIRPADALYYMFNYWMVEVDGRSFLWREVSMMPYADLDGPICLD
jgi:hypothetical protein